MDAGPAPKSRERALASGSGGVNGEGGGSGGRRSGGKGGGQEAGMMRSDDWSLGEGIGRKSPLGLKVSGVFGICRRSTMAGKAGVKEEAKLSPESEVLARSGGSLSGGSAPAPGKRRPPEKGRFLSAGPLLGAPGGSSSAADGRCRRSWMNLVGDETSTGRLGLAGASAAEVVGRVAGVLAGGPVPRAPPLGGATRALEEAKVRYGSRSARAGSETRAEAAETARCLAIARRARVRNRPTQAKHSSSATPHSTAPATSSSYSMDVARLNSADADVAGRGRVWLKPCLRNTSCSAVATRLQVAGWPRQHWSSPQQAAGGPNWYSSQLRSAQQRCWQASAVVARKSR